MKFVKRKIRVARKSKRSASHGNRPLLDYHELLSSIKSLIVVHTHDTHDPLSPDLIQIRSEA
jgi:pantothenate kinase-related protein Tda10